MSSSNRDLLRWDDCANRLLAGGPKLQIAYELQLFRSRWRLAWHFQGFNALDFSDATLGRLLSCVPCLPGVHGA